MRKFKIIGVIVILANLSISSQGLLFGDFGLSSAVAGYEVPEAELKRDKRTLTTICVEIKPSSPYEEPYFMCKGTDTPKYSKGSGSGSSDSYSVKPSYKPSKSSTYASGESDSYHSEVKKTNDYHAPSKPEYHAEHPKYDKPQSTYDSAKEYSAPSKPSYDKNLSYDDHGIHHHGDAYPNYEVPSKPSSYASVKPSYTDHHDSQDDYSKPHHQAHKVTYEKPSAPTYSSRPQAYGHEIQSAYDHRQPSAGYSKTSSYESHSAPGGYSRPSSSYEPAEYSKPSSYDHSSSHDAKPSYSGESHSKPSYSGHDGHSYSVSPETKVLYSKPASYPAKQVSYEHADNAQYGQPTTSYSEQPSSKPYPQPTQDYGKPAPYTSNEQNSGYAPQPQNYRMMPQELMQPTWEPQPQQFQNDGFSYRSYGAPMVYQNLETPRMMNHESQLYTGLEGPLRFDLSDSDQEAPTLQSPYPQQTYSSHAHHGYQGSSYGPVSPSYAPPIHYVPSAPSHPGTAYHSAAPSYAPVPSPSYVPLQVPSPSYAPAATSSPSHGPSTPACPPNYMYSFQPVIMSVPCYSWSASYSPSTYGQALGAPSSNINPLQDHTNARSEGNSDPRTKSAEDHSDSQESKESDKKPDSEVEISQTAPKKSENLKKPSDIAEEKQQVDKNNAPDPVVGVEKPIKESQIAQTGAVAPGKSFEGPHTKEAFNAMMKMSRIAAQLNKDEANKGTSSDALDDGSAAVQGNEKTSGSLPQFSRTQ